MDIEPKEAWCSLGRIQVSKGAREAKGWKTANRSVSMTIRLPMRSPSRRMSQYTQGPSSSKWLAGLLQGRGVSMRTSCLPTPSILRKRPSSSLRERLPEGTRAEYLLGTALTHQPGPLAAPPLREARGSGGGMGSLAGQEGHSAL